MSIDKKTAIVTGASRGIGLEIALYFASKGYSLLMISKNLETLDQAKETVRQKHPEAHISTSAIDISDHSLISNSILNFYEQFNRIDVVFNNAGYVKRGTSELDPSEFKKMIDVNIIGAYNVIHVCAPLLKHQESGHIINISSRNAKIPRSFLGGYAATKAAILAFNESLYKELSDFGIKVTALVPGFVNTHMTSEVNLPREDLIQPSEFGKFLDLILSADRSVAIKEMCFEATPQVGKYS